MKWVLIAIIFVGALLLGAVLIDRRFIDKKEDLGAVVIRMTLVPAVERFHHDVHRYPTTEEGLTVLVQRPAEDRVEWRGPYLDGSKVPIDPWGRAFRYRAPGRRSCGSFDVWSTGPDGVDSDDDFGNWQK